MSQYGWTIDVESGVRFNWSNKSRCLIEDEMDYLIDSVECAKKIFMESEVYGELLWCWSYLYQDEAEPWCEVQVTTEFLSIVLDLC